MATVALVTDFGRADSYVAEVHLAIKRRVPSAVIVDGSHDVAPYDRVAAALVAERVFAQLPRGSALVVVVDPGVGTSRKRLIVSQRGRWLIGPDNGVLPIEGSAEVFALSERWGAMDESVTTFDGREVFGPVGAMLAAGLDVRLVAERIATYERCMLGDDAQWFDRASERYAHGHVIAIDRFGNAVTNARCPRGSIVSVREPAKFRGPLRRAYGEVAHGEPLALVGSSGRIELSVREGHSGLGVGEEVVLSCAL